MKIDLEQLFAFGLALGLPGLLLLWAFTLPITFEWQERKIQSIKNIIKKWYEQKKEKN